MSFRRAMPSFVSSNTVSAMTRVKGGLLYNSGPVFNLDSWTLGTKSLPWELRPEGPRAEVGFLGGTGSRLPTNYGTWGAL